MGISTISPSEIGVIDQLNATLGAPPCSDMVPHPGCPILSSGEWREREQERLGYPYSLDQFPVKWGTVLSYLEFHNHLIE